jgi:iron complex transport system ATP-binding protein
VTAQTLPLLQVNNLSAGYGERRVLEGVSLSLNAGEVLAVIGPNGSGKSTLIRTISAAADIYSGEVLLSGRRMPGMPAGERARLLAVVPQARNLPAAYSVRETVLLGRTPHLGWLGLTSDADEEISRQAMLRTETLDLAGRRIGELSGGEQQRVLLARALAQAAPLLLLDEPTAHLDLKYQVTLLDLVRQLAHHDGYGVLVALHDLNLAARTADRVAVIVHGRLAAYGTPAEVLQPELLSKVYHIPLKVIPNGKDGPGWIFPSEEQNNENRKSK